MLVLMEMLHVNAFVSFFFCVKGIFVSISASMLYLIGRESFFLSLLPLKDLAVHYKSAGIQN